MYPQVTGFTFSSKIWVLQRPIEIGDCPCKDAQEKLQKENTYLTANTDKTNSIADAKMKVVNALSCTIWLTDLIGALHCCIHLNEKEKVGINKKRILLLRAYEWTTDREKKYKAIRKGIEDPTLVARDLKDAKKITQMWQVRYSIIVDLKRKNKNVTLTAWDLDQRETKATKESRKYQKNQMLENWQ